MWNNLHEDILADIASYQEDVADLILHQALLTRRARDREKKKAQRRRRKGCVHYRKARRAQWTRRRLLTKHKLSWRRREAQRQKRHRAYFTDEDLGDVQKYVRSFHMS